MGFLNRFRRNREGDPTNKTSSNRQTRYQEKYGGPQYFDEMTTELNRRPSVGQWIKMTWLDILTFIAMGAIGLGVYEADPAPSRSFPLYFEDGEIVYPEYAYPLRHEIIPIWAAALLGVLVPIFFFLVMQIRIRSFWVCSAPLWQSR